MQTQHFDAPKVIHTSTRRGVYFMFSSVSHVLSTCVWIAGIQTLKQKLKNYLTSYYQIKTNPDFWNLKKFAIVYYLEVPYLNEFVSENLNNYSGLHVYLPFRASHFRILSRIKKCH